MRRAREVVLTLPYMQRAYWLKRLDAEMFDAIPALTSWIAKGETDVTPA